MQSYLEIIKKELKGQEILGRISAQYRDIYKVIVNDNEILAKVSGKFIYNSYSKEDYPVVGDYVLLDRDNDTKGNAIIEKIFERKTVFKRKDINNGQNEILASNIDYIFVCMALNNDFNLRRLERYITVCYESGATPVVILTKSDLCDDIESKVFEVENIAIGIDILVVSNLDKSCIKDIFNYLKCGITGCFVGSSGVGKSTLINNLLGEVKLETNGIRNDDKGRHTTTRREMFTLKNGSIVIDTPGMRELSVDSENIDKTFLDISELEKLCKFSDCTHTNEPKCAIREALENGTLCYKRYNNYLKLKEESKYINLNFKEIEKEKIKKMFGSKSEYKNAIRHIKNKR
ncbi:ribosome small subunit-dependent GTPase A [[Clostridium] colinum]|uniref:ribosome small subunit-dependent GTPase A n=1 Tax=[Clostridium] colinum TaxID=36835 RepID=UPI002024D784|nr:ribosome small subunit-dependent GTPase A [[Clostridium] colinum]